MNPFTVEERSIIRNLPLLAMASRKFIKSGLAALAGPRLESCIKQFCEEQGLYSAAPTNREKADFYTGYNADVPELDNQVDEESDNILFWPEYRLHLFWKGSSSANAPRLGICSKKSLNTVPEIFCPNTMTVRLDFTAFRIGLRDRDEADRLMESHGFRPDQSLWVLPERAARFDSPWHFYAKEQKNVKFAFDASALLKSRPISLLGVCPTLAKLVEDYVSVCSKFETMFRKRPVRPPRNHQIVKLPKIHEKGEEVSILREHASGLLLSAGAYIKDEELSLRGRIRCHIMECIRKYCRNHGCSELQYPPPVSDLSSYNDPSTTSVWRVDGCTLTLLFTIDIPDGVDETDLKISSWVYINPFRDDPVPWSFKKFQKLWDDSWASKCFGPAWERKRANKPGTFWGYWTPMGTIVDLDKLADANPDCIAGLTDILKTFIEASQRFEKTLRGR